MNIKPNAFQKVVHRLLILRPVSTFLAFALHRVDTFLLGLTDGKHTVTRIVGLPIIRLTTTGAKTGQARTMPLVSLFDGDTIALIASNFGGKHSPGWYYNLKANPECRVGWGGSEKNYVARETQGEEREKYWQMAVSYYAGYGKYEERAVPRHIPVMVLEPKK